MEDRALDVVLCARQSVAREGSMSIETQFDAGRKEARRRGWKVLAEIDDDDVSGAKSPFERPAVGQWLAGKKGHYDALVFAKIDRASRDTLSGLQLLTYLQDSGKRLIILSPYIDSSMMTPLDRLQFVISLEFGSYERQQGIERIRNGARTGRKHARYLGGRVPPWLKVVSHESGDGWALTLDDDNAVIILKIIESVLRNKKWLQICNDLDREKVPTPDQLRNPSRPGRKIKLRKSANAEKKWLPTSIKEMLSNRLLIGEKEVIKRDEARKIVSREIVKDDGGRPVKYCPALIDYATFKKLIEIINTPRSKATERNKSELQGVVRCIECHSICHSETSPGNGVTYEYYRCYAKTKYKSCSAKSVPKAPIFAYLEENLLEIAGDEEVYEKIDPLPSPDAGKLEKLSDDRDELIGLFRSVNSESGRKKLEADIAALDAEICELENALANPPEPTYVPTGKIFRAMWESSTWNQRGDLLRDLGIVFEVGVKERSFVGSLVLPEDIGQRLRDVTSGQDSTAYAPPEVVKLDQERRNLGVFRPLDHV